jgi:hypothetical protein
MMTIHLVALGNLLRLLILILAHRPGSLIIVLLGHFYAVPLVLDGPDVVANIADAVPKLAEI